MTNRFGILLDETRTNRLMSIAECMECAPEDVIFTAIDRMWLKVTED